MIDLFPDQIDTISRTYGSFKAGNQAVLLQAATGAGKSVMASYIIKNSLKSGRTTWFIVPRRDLVRQMGDTYDAFGIDYGIIAAGKKYVPNKPAYICSAGSMKSRLDFIQPPDRAIIDEVHFGKDTLDYLIKWLKSKGALILGLSATPNRADGRGLDCWFDDMVCGPSIKWLIANKRLASYRAFAPDHIDLSNVRIQAGDYNQKQLSQLMEQNKVLIGNAVSHYKKHAMGRLGVTFCVGIAHSQMMAESYRNAGVPAMHMDGDTPEDERRRIARAFAKGELLQLCNSDLLTFGYDLSSASGIKDVCIEIMTDCKPTRSLPLQMQKWGRNLRYSPEPHIFFDHANNFETHGFPADDREWSLHSVDKKKRGAASERNVEVKVCMPDANGPGCYFAHPPSPVCPNCGHVYEVVAREIEEVEGELKEVERVALAREKRMEVGMAKTMDDLRRIQRERGYSSWWVNIIAEKKGIYK